MTNIREQDKRKGGRPPTGRVRKLSKSVTVKFSKPSYEALKLRARKANRKLAEKETTGGQYKRIGEIYGFPVKIVCETSFENGLPFVDNRFFVEGNYKYQYNYGHIAKSDPIAAANNFLNALQKIPSYIEQYDSRCKALEKEIPQLEEIAGKTWKKEEELKGLKAELAALDRKIQLELAPPQEQDTAEKHEAKNIETEQSIVGKQARSVCRL